MNNLLALFTCLGLSSFSGTSSTSLPHNTLAVPQYGVYAGAFMDFGDTEDDVSLEKILSFEELAGKHQAIVASSSYWGQQTFPRRNLDIITNHGSVPIVYWSPWDKPYNQERPPDRFSLDHILNGDWNDYIDRWADAARRYGKPFFVAWGLEMNGTWFPWSGYWYPSHENGRNNPDYKAGVEKYKKAYRYVVDRVRARGAGNILWVFHVNNYSYPTDSWNDFKNFYPGDNYVDWIGMSAYGKQFKKNNWVYFPDTMNYPYQLLCQLSPDKPLMLAEWGVGQFQEPKLKADFISQALQDIPRKYPRIKAAVFWHERWENEDGTYSNLRLDSSLEAFQAFRKGMTRDPLWLSSPIWK